MLRSKKTCWLLVLMILVGVAGNAQVHAGQLAREIVLPSVKGDSIRLSSLKGKVVLIDFWASWCGPCRISNKQLVKIYDKYKDKGFEIYGISVDEDRRDWEKAVQKDRITWLQVIDDAGSASQTIRTWNVYQIPTSYLVDQNGRLVAMDLDSRSLDKKLRQMLE